MVKNIEILLLVFGFTNIFSGFMFTFTEPSDNWLWFSRFSIGIICLGLYAILKKMNYVEKIK